MISLLDMLCCMLFHNGGVSKPLEFAGCPVGFGIVAAAIEYRFAANIPKRWTVGCFAAGNKAVMALAVAAHKDAYMVNLRTVSMRGVEEYDVSNAQAVEVGNL
jgi:hypothetical protein